MAICKACGKKYSKWTAPVGARGACRDCFEPELSTEPEVEPELVSSSGTTPAAKPKARIRLTSFIPRSRSKVVFVLVMSCYSSTLGALVATWARVAHVQRPPRAFYLSGDIADVVGLLMVAPIVESLILVGVFELVRRARAPEIVQVLTAAFSVSEAHVWPWWPHAVIVFTIFLYRRSLLPLLAS